MPSCSTTGVSNNSFRAGPLCAQDSYPNLVGNASKSQSRLEAVTHRTHQQLLARGGQIAHVNDQGKTQKNTRTSRTQLMERLEPNTHHERTMSLPVWNSKSSSNGTPSIFYANRSNLKCDSFGKEGAVQLVAIENGMSFQPH